MRKETSSMIEVVLPDGRVVEVETNDPQIAAKAAAKFAAQQQKEPSVGRNVAEFIGRELGSVAGTSSGAAFGGGMQLVEAARNLDPMALLRAVPETVQGGIAGELAGRGEGRRRGGELFDQFMSMAFPQTAQGSGAPQEVKDRLGTLGADKLDFQSPIRIPRAGQP
jgi:hypothetical protein